MQTTSGYEHDELRALLQEARGARRQSEIAAAAKVSIGLYKRLESGRLHTSRLATLMRIADALGLTTGERAKLITLARPDLARMTETESSPTDLLLSTLCRLTVRLGRVHGRGAALRTAVEFVHASLGCQGMSFVFELRNPGAMRGRFSVGADLWNRAFPPGFQAVTTNFGTQTARRKGSGVQTLCVGIHEKKGVVTVLGVASTSEGEFDPKYAEFLETIAAVLEIRLREHAVPARW